MKLLRQYKIRNTRNSSYSIHGLHLAGCLAHNHELKYRTFTKDSNTSPSYLATFSSLPPRLDVPDLLRQDTCGPWYSATVTVLQYCKYHFPTHLIESVLLPPHASHWPRQTLSDTNLNISVKIFFIKSITHIILGINHHKGLHCFQTPRH